MHVYEVRPPKDRRGVDLISGALPFGRLWYDGPNAVANAIGYATHRSRSHDAVNRVYDTANNVIETHEHAGNGRSLVALSRSNAFSYDSRDARIRLMVCLVKDHVPKFPFVH